MATESSYPMLPVAEALEIVLRETEALRPVAMVTADAVGRILATDVHAQEPLPPFPASVKDGYAVIASDGPGTYPIVEKVTAGIQPQTPLRAGEVAYITTGAPIPTGADAVVMVEETTPSNRSATPHVQIHKQVTAGDDIRPIGSDIASGELVLQAGNRLDAAEIGLLATVGVVETQVYPRPKVAILSTGDELVEPDAQLGPGQIRDSNRAMLQAAVLANGGVPIDLGIATDQQATLAEQMMAGIQRADILLTSGGVSMGELDLIKPILEEAGTVHFGRIRMKPGKPLTFATLSATTAERTGGTAGGTVAEKDERNKLVFGLPGNPVSSLVTFYLFVVPTLRKLAGWPNPHLRRVQAELAEPLTLDPERPEYHRATLRWEQHLNSGNGGFLAASTGRQASSRLLSMRTANALLELPQAPGRLEAGAVISALLIGAVEAA